MYHHLAEPRIIIALDYPNTTSAWALVEQLEPAICRLKVGKELFIRGGAQFVERLQAKGFEVFLDLKFHDIPNTVAAACRAAAELGVWMVNIHALGGSPMMQAAVEALASYPAQTIGVAVTVLTSLDKDDLHEIGLSGEVDQQVIRLANLAKQSGLAGVVCSAQELVPLRQSLGNDFLLITPGIRPLDANIHDQKRVMTPKQAIAAGASYLVIGRAITQSHRPLESLAAINTQLNE